LYGIGDSAIGKPQSAHQAIELHGHLIALCSVPHTRFTYGALEVPFKVHKRFHLGRTRSTHIEGYLTGTGGHVGGHPR
jgi:hypothetical protein